ncbi:ABC transporter permease [Desulfosporosinus nitroreducens]|uniref:ABC transporter permease n=1 Tax=Desulfosporosinus nitroreducens TaxID=2018668 RepID=A0ABT8QX58_9FIRM|nr:ABC transporter permease [Desulfosporosinus nitroreducens]MCO1604413.1 ABC transporter permease [Desulfosporosinus nitroreducens]MDO0825936.1 ABC transporter permease [Desulfosporosinus nitroreducens]
MFTQIALGTMEQGLMYAIMVLGVYLTFRILDYADLSVDGSFTLGAATATSLIVGGTDPWIATGMAFIAGTLAGLFTGILHTKFKITPLLSGILTMTALYSINLRVMGRANISLLGSRTVFSDFAKLPFMEEYGVLVLSLGSVLLIGAVIYLFLQTELGLALRATGDNELMIRSLGVNTDLMKILGLGLSNGLVAFAGSYVAQKLEFADASMGIGMIIAGLASVIIGEVLVGTSSIGRAILAVICGAVLYRAIIAVVLQLGLEATDLKLITSFIVIIALVSPTLRKKIASWSAGVSGKEAQ